MLDSKELFHLALKEMQEGSTEKAIKNLKQCQEAEPDNAKVVYLLGALHAELGMYDRAVEEMQKATEMDPTLTTASFQLGLLHFSSGNVSEASKAWQALDSQGQNDPLFLFKRGMLHLVENKFEDCISDLEQGITLNTSNEALNNDMRNIIAGARQALNGITPEDHTDQDSEDQKSQKNMSLSAYENQENH